MASNIIQLSFNGETSVVSEELVYKYDYGQQIEFTDLTLPEYFEVHFSNNKTGKATKQIGHNGVVDIPDRYLEIGSVYGWIFLHNTDSDGETEYEFKIPVKNRAMPSDGEVTPEQESAISQAIAALTSTQASVQALHDETEGYRDDASASSSYAHDAQTAAEAAQDAAEMAETSAGFSKIAAEAAQSAAEIAQGKAEDAQTAAESAQAAAEAARDDVLGMSAEAETLPAGSSATASYADGVLSLGIPRGDKGETGDTGATGETGNGIASVVKTSTSGLVDTYTITYTDGTTSTFEVTNGKDGEDSDVQDVQIDGTSILSDGVANIPTADTYYTSRYGVVKLADVVESGDNYNTIQLKYTRQGSAKSKTLATSAVATTSKRGLMSKDDKAKLDAALTDVQVDGTSIVADGVATLPYAVHNTSVQKDGIISHFDMAKLNKINAARPVHNVQKGCFINPNASQASANWLVLGDPDEMPIAISPEYEVLYQIERDYGEYKAGELFYWGGTLRGYLPLPYNTMSQLSALLPTDTASGSIASFPDGTDLFSALSVKAQIEPIQDLHGYDKPWAGGAGKNILNVGSRVSQTTAGVTYTSDDNYVILNGTKNGGGYADLSTLTLALDVGTYYAKAFEISGTQNPSTAAGLYVYDGSTNLTASSIIGTERQFTLSEAKTVRFRFGIFTDGVVYTNWKIGIVISKTSGIDKYYPYSNICPISGHTECVTYVSPTTSETEAETYTTDLGRTVYGGTLDVVSGVLVVDRVKETYEWSDGAGATTLGDYTRKVFKTAYASVRQYSGDNIQICDCLSWKHNYTEQSAHFYVDTGNAGVNNCVVFLPNGTTTQTLNIVYGLATPQTYQLDPQEVTLLLGQNNLWTDCGSVEVTYKADTQKYIDKKFAELQALVLEQ